MKKVLREHGLLDMGKMFSASLNVAPRKQARAETKKLKIVSQLCSDGNLRN